MDSLINNDDKLHRVRRLLIEHRGSENWKSKDDGWGIEGFDGKECPKDIANLFLLRCLIDYQCKATDAWNRGAKHFDSLEPERKCELWRTIAEIPRNEWNSEESFRRWDLHRWHRVHNRIWPIADSICRYFGGDARRIWQGTMLFDVLCRLYYIGAGEQISRMIVGALKDCGQISGTSDVKADLHVCRVLGRVFYGNEATPGAAIKLARELKPDDPWQLDMPLWNLGQTKCDSTFPKCTSCYLAEDCKFAQEHALRD
jgi:hypothetical protein